jgi:predicted dehydrogenase
MPSILGYSILENLCPELTRWNNYTKHINLKLAIVGFGKMGLLHSGILNLLAPRTVKAVVDKNFVLTFGVSKIIKTIKFYKDLDSMLNEVEPDAVYITTPTSSHQIIAEQLLKKGVKYIFIEKPPTVNYEQAYKLTSIKKLNQHIMIGFQKRYSLTFRHAKLLIESNVIGHPCYVYSYIKSGDILNRTSRFDPLGRGVLLDLGVHLINLLTSFFRITRVHKAEFQSIHTRVDDLFIAELDTHEGARIFLEATWSDPDHRLPETYIEIQGTLGTIKVTEDYLMVRTRGEYPLLGKKREVTLYKPHYYQGLPPVNLADPEYTIENIHFLTCIIDNREPLTNIEESLKTMQLIDELYGKAGRATRNGQ